MLAACDVLNGATDVDKTKNNRDRRSRLTLTSAETQGHMD